jgi:hypothetical protein
MFFHLITLLKIIFIELIDVYSVSRYTSPMSITPDDDGFFPDGVCPICAAHCDPVTGEELFNAKTVAAIEEGRAMMRGEIPSKLYDSLEEMLADLDADD